MERKYLNKYSIISKILRSIHLRKIFDYIINRIFEVLSKILRSKDITLPIHAT